MPTVAGQRGKRQRAALQPHVGGSWDLSNFPVVYKDAFDFVLVSPPPGGSGGGPKGIEGFGPIPARIWRETYFDFHFGLQRSWG